MTFAYWISTGISAGLLISYLIKARNRRRWHAALKPGDKIWLTKLAHTQGD